jgi:hypothetical protein
LLRDEELAGKDVMTFKSGDVAVLGCFKKQLTVVRNGKSFKLTAPVGAADSVVICEGVDNTCFHAPRDKSVTVKLENGTAEYLSPSDGGKKIFKLMKDGYMVDQVVVK